ncbi:hypothetical protein GQ457_09G021090 [Hibiscus cannabinus]
MKMMNFDDKWCNWISNCISTASISVLVNGVPTDSFQIARGLRQGCSLSPMLFNIVGECLNLLLSKAVRASLFSGFVIGRGSNSMEITHLQFADDLIIFCDASLDQVRNIKRVLRVFELASGLQLNLKKVVFLELTFLMLSLEIGQLLLAVTWVIFLRIFGAAAWP